MKRIQLILKVVLKRFFVVKGDYLKKNNKKKNNN